ncbi:hypothetical protein Leryth_004498 [Lithospermum erythrorhizon]|nr:hypothetical protein Leryth_004498 [Lithospermum erythrorhizon]
MSNQGGSLIGGQINNKDGILLHGQLSNQGGSLIGGQIQNQGGILIGGQMQNQGGSLVGGQINHMQQQEMSGNYQMLGQLQNPGGSWQSMGPESLKARHFMRGKIYEFFMGRQQQTPAMPQSKMMEIVKRLEEGLHKNSISQDEYLNLGTLESRLHALARRAPVGNRNPQYSNVNSPSSIGTMIPTPGTSQSRNSSLIAASHMDNSMGLSNNNNSGAFATSNSGNLLPTTNGHAAGGIPGSLTQPEVNGNMVTDAERMRTQMMPTPGFSNANGNMNLVTNNHSYTSVESTMVTQPLQQKPHAGGGNSRILRNLGTHMSAGIKSTLQASYGLSSGTLSGGVGNNGHLMNVPAPSEGYPTTTMSGNSARQLDQLQQPLSQGNVYAMPRAGASGSGNIQANLHTAQHMNNLNPQLVDQLNYPSQSSFSGNLVQSHEHWKFQQEPHQLLQTDNQQNGQNQQHHSLLDNNAFGQSYLSSNLGSLLKSEAESDSYIGAMHSQAPEQQQFSDVPTQVTQNSINNNSRNSQWQSFPSGPQISPSSLNQASQQMPQILHQDQFLANSQSDFRYPSRGVQADAITQSQWYPKPQDESPAPVNYPSEPDVQQKYSQRITGLDETRKNNISSYASMNGQVVAAPSEDQLNISGSIRRSHGLDRKQQFRNQQRWLLFLHHARRCPYPEGKCLHTHCITAQKLLLHIEQCHVFECPYPRCRGTLDLINHHRRCKDTGCPVCVPVKNYVGTHLKAHTHSDSRTSSYSVIRCSTPFSPSEVAGRSSLKTSPVVDENAVNLEPFHKRVKIVHSLQPDVSETETNIEPNTTGSEIHGWQESAEKQSNTGARLKSQTKDIKMEFTSIGGRVPESNALNSESLDGSCMQRSNIDPGIPDSGVDFAQEESIKFEKEESGVKLQSISVPLENASGSKSGKPKVKGVSLIELFTPEEVREHIQGLRQWVGQSKAKVEKNQAMRESMSENSCQLCAVEKLTFEPPPIYCSTCGGRIKRNAMYYTIGAGESRHWFCIHCHNAARGETIMVEKIPIPKARLEKKKNDEETEEWWVQCDRCEAWQHQICALFNGRRNDGGQAEYTCPNCYILEVERGERIPLPQSAVLGAKDLPRTILSDHIENRLAGKLKQERQDRANFLGKSIDEVPGADGIVVRVVSSVDKKLEIKPQFLEIFKEENYPSEFPYKSKVLLFFQNIEGVEVCLFGMYVQEFGSECVQPNNRRVYLSYLDSVKYFRPEIKTISGESLRTYVYHEILIGYLEYCKMRGFASCYIWACPPPKGEDYILYCHPEIQKTPKSDKLREWYLSMLKKAARENIVVERTNLYDHFFVSTGECRAKVTAARLPYFDGDYWPGAAEDMILQLQEEDEGRKLHKKKSITKRALKAAGQTDLSGNASKDLMLMHKLGETIYAMREDFIMVHLQYSCTHCCMLMVSGKRWACNSCKTFNLCDKCYDAELKREDRERHPINQKFKHPLHPVEIKNVPCDTKDEDEILESEFFDTRHAFLSLCQGNHYQYDTLRRAKHSSMMVLYYLHNPTVPAFVTQCVVCHLDIEAGQGWRCDTCTDYDVCNACYSKDGCVNHPHKLTNNPSVADVNAQSKEARQLRVTQLKKLLELLVHASQCRSPQCNYPNCIKVKLLFRHGFQCKVRASGGCPLCKKMWYLLQLHARACKESKCNVPRCRDLRDHLKRLQQQSDSRRRAAVMEMMRQRTEEVAGSSG